MSEASEISTEPNWVRVASMNNDWHPAPYIAQAKEADAIDLSLRLSSARHVDPGEAGMEALAQFIEECPLPTEDDRGALAVLREIETAGKTAARDSHLSDGSDASVRELMFDAIVLAYRSISFYEALRRTLDGD